MFTEVINYIKYNKIYIIMAMMVIASVFATFSFGQIAYFVAMGVTFVYCTFKNQQFEGIFASLLVWILFGMVMNNVFPVQYAYFVLMIACASPMFSSYDAFVFRTRLLYALCLILPVITVLNLYAYQVGINMYIEIMTLERVAAYNFSGFLHHPMWLAAINGMSNVTLLYLFYKQKESKWWIKGAIVVMLIFSLYLSVVAASRAALSASLLAMATMVYFESKTSGKLVRSTMIIGVLAYLLIPFITSDSTAMRTKIDAENRGEASSRDMSWGLRIDEFKESPIWGVGFATGYVSKGWRTSGTLETGSGWLAILAQTGLIGALFFFVFIKRAALTVDEIKENGGLLILFSCIFIYLAAHSVFEGYIYTAGYCPCMFFWLTLSFFYEYNKYGYPEEVEDPMIVYEEDDEEEDDDDENDEEDELEGESENHEAYHPDRLSPHYV